VTAEEKLKALEQFRALLTGKLEVFHSPEREPFVRVAVDDHRENYPLVKKGAFAEWCQYVFFATTEASLPKKIFEMMLEQLQAQAKFGAPEFQTPVRVAEHGGNIYLDLCDDKWRCVEITPRGWTLIDNPPVRFRRSPGMLPLPVPQPGGNLQAIFRFLNVKNSADRKLVLAWLLAAYRPTGPYPILALHGSQGSAKTTTETILRRMIDPAKANLSGVPRDERDVLISVRHSHLLGFDNFSSVSDSLSDVLCRVATGSGLATRKLYTDDTQTIFNGCRPILLNGITDLATRGDLLDRMIVLYLPKINESERREEQVLLREFEAAQPRILGAMLDAVSEALRMVNKVKFTKLPRMADFAIWTAAGAKALGFDGQELVDAYERNRVEANFIALENSPAAIEIFKWAAKLVTPWEGTYGQLLTQLNALALESAQRDPHWPKSARKLQGDVARCESNLAAAGVTITKLPREPGTGRRNFRVSFVTSSQPQVTLKEEVPLVCDVVTVQSQKSVQPQATAEDVSTLKVGDFFLISPMAQSRTPYVISSESIAGGISFSRGI